MKTFSVFALVLAACSPPIPSPVSSSAAPSLSVPSPVDGGEEPAGAVYEPVKLLAVRYVVVVDGLNVRAHPSATADVVGWLQAGDRVAVREYNGKWGFIGSGWVAMRYLALDE